MPNYSPTDFQRSPKVPLSPASFSSFVRMVLSLVPDDKDDKGRPRLFEISGPTIEAIVKGVHGQKLTTIKKLAVRLWTHACKAEPNQQAKFVAVFLQFGFTKPLKELDEAAFVDFCMALWSGDNRQVESTFPPAHPEILEAARTVNQFYSAIQSQDYKSAWNLLTLAFRKRIWRNKFPAFQFGYKSTRGFIRLEIFPLELFTGGESASILAFWQEQVDIPLTPELENLGGYHLGELDSFVVRLKTFATRLKKSGCNQSAINSIQIAKLLFADKSEYLRFQLRLPENQVTKVLGESHWVKISRLKNHTCVKTLAGWKIDSIRPLHPD